MKKFYLPFIFLFPFLSFAALLASAADGGNLLVRTGDGNLVIIHPGGTQELISEGTGVAAFSPDHRAVAFTVVHVEKGQAQTPLTIDAKLVVMTLSTRVTTEIVHLPTGAGFQQIGWAPDGNSIAYEAISRDKSDDLFLAPFPPERGSARNLGHWAQGFSFSPDGARIVHAINSPFALEVLEIASGKRTLLLKANNVIWDAKFSPNGKLIAYTKTVGEPAPTDAGAEDDAPDCTAPNTELRLYSLGDGSDSAVRIPKAGESVYHFSWSPGSRQIAIELGTEDCGSPSGDSAVFVTSTDQKVQTQVSVSSPASQPVFSPDGTAIAFVDSSRFPTGLFRYDLSKGTRELIRRAAPRENTYQLLDWK
jgi:Tol biopolymer transport system component